MGKSTYNSIDELPDLTQEEIHVADPITKAVKTYKSVDELPDLKKKVGSNVSATPLETTSVQSGNGLSTTPKVKSTLADFGILPSIIPQNQQINQPVSTQAVQPKATATYDDFVAHNAERKEKKAKLVDEAIDNTARKILKNKGIVKPEEEGKSLNLSQYQQLAKEKKRLQEDFASGDVTFGISKGGEVGLNRTTGWWEALKGGWNNSMKANDEAAAFADMDAAQKVDYLHQKETEQAANPHPEFIGEKGSALSSVTGLVGENAPFLIKAGEGAATGAALIAAAPETLGASLVGLPAATAFIFTANDSKNQGIQSEVTRRFYQLKQQNPNVDDVSLMKEAENGALVGGLAGIATNAALMTSVKAPLSLEGKTVVGKAISKAIGSSVYAGAATAGIEGAKLAEGNLEGVKTAPTEIAKEMGKTFSETATTLGVLHVLTGAATGAFKLPKMVSSAMKYALKDADPQQLAATLKANEQAGKIPEGTTEKVIGEIDAYKVALSKTVDGLPPEAEASVAGLIEAKTKLIEEAKTKDSSAKPYYDERIAGIDEQIQKTLNTGKPFSHEIDEMSGDRYTPKPIDKPVSTETGQSEGQSSEQQVSSSPESVSNGATKATTSVLEGSDVKSEEVDFMNKTFEELEQRQSDLEDEMAGNKDFGKKQTLQKEHSAIDKELEKRERDSVFSVPLEEVKGVIDGLIKKDKERPGIGFGTYIEMRDARETKSVAEKYLNPKEITDAELKQDFRDAVLGNPSTWYADGLKLRESMKEASNRGIEIKNMIAKIEKEYIKDGYSAKDAHATVARKLKPIFEGSPKVETNESKLVSENKPIQQNELSKAKELVNSGVVKGFTADVLKDAANNNEAEFKGHLKDIAEQAQDPRSESATIKTYGQELVDEANKLFPKNEETKTTQVPNTTEGSSQPKEVANPVIGETSGGGKEPPKTETTEGETNKFRDKGILNRLAAAEKVPEASKKGFEEKGLKYEPQTAQEAESIGKAMVDQYGIDDAVTLAEAAKFKGGVNSAIFAESLNRVFKEEQDAKTPEAKLEAAKRFAEIGIRYDEFSRGQGRDISQIGHFYKQSPLGIKIMEETRRRENFDEYAKNKDKSWKEFFDEMQKDPEFEKEFKSKVSEELKKERAASREKRIKKVDAFFDDAIKKLGNGGAAYSTFIPITPKVLQGALKGMKEAYHAGEKVAKIIEDAIDYINKEVGGGWDKEAFKKEWAEKLGENELKGEIPIDKREKMLERFKKKLKGLSDKEKEDVIRKSFKKLVENGALDYADFKKIIADTLGYGEMTPEQAKKLIDLVGDINKVDDLATALRDNDRSEKGLKDYQEAKKKAEKSATELGKLVFNKPEILKRILSIMQLNTLGVPSLVNNPIFNVFNQATVRLPRSIIMSGLDYGINKIGKAFGKNIERENNVISAQKEFYKKLGEGSSQSIEQLRTGLTNSDYFQKEVKSSQIHPWTSVKELWSAAKGETKLNTKQIVDKSLQATFGAPAEVVARVLNIGDKPQRFAAEGAQAAVFAKNLGLQGIDYKLFMEFPKEEAYRAFKKQGLSEEAAMKKAEDVQSRIIKEGEESTFQQDNLLNDVITGAFEALKKGGDKAYGLGQVVKTLNMPFVKIPLNAFWSVFNLANPEVAFIQSLTYATKAYKTKSPIDIQQAKKWFAHGVTGLAWMGVTGALAKAGVINSGNADDTTKKEREGEQFYEQQNTINMGKLQALMQGQDPSKVKDGLLVDLKWLGNMGILMGYQAKKIENLTPEQKEAGTTLMEDLMSNMTESAVDFADKGVFSNTGAMYTAISKGGRWMDSYLMNLINMGTNIVQPATFAQMSRAELPYYSKAKADNFIDEVNNNLLIRSSWLRKLSGEYPPSKVSIWGNQSEKKDDTGMRLFGISKQNDDNFAQPIYNDYKRTHNTKFFPSSVKPEIDENGVKTKLTTKETAELETLVGQARKQLVAPYINGMATFEGSDKKYSELSDEEKTNNLEILYKTGYETGKFQFLQAHPKLKQPEPSEESVQAKKEKERNNESLRKEAKDKMGVE